MQVFKTQVHEPIFLGAYGGLLLAVGYLFVLGILSKKWVVVKPIVQMAILLYSVQVIDAALNFINRGVYSQTSYILFIGSFSIFLVAFFVEYVINNRK